MSFHDPKHVELARAWAVGTVHPPSAILENIETFYKRFGRDPKTFMELGANNIPLNLLDHIAATNNKPSKEQP